MFFNYTNFHFFRFLYSLKHNFLTIFFKFSVIAFTFLILFFTAGFILSYLVKVFGLSLGMFFYLNNLVIFDFVSISLLFLFLFLLFFLFLFHSIFSVLTILNDYVYTYSYRLFLFFSVLFFHFELLFS